VSSNRLSLTIPMRLSLKHEIWTRAGIRCWKICLISKPKRLRICRYAPWLNLAEMIIFCYSKSRSMSTLLVRRQCQEVNPRIHESIDLVLRNTPSSEPILEMANKFLCSGSRWEKRIMSLQLTSWWQYTVVRVQRWMCWMLRSSVPFSSLNVGATDEKVRITE
jgi:hypothetical protein